MVTKATSSSSSKSRKSHGEDSSGGTGNLLYKLNQLKKQIQAERVTSIKEKVAENRKNLKTYMSKVLSGTSNRNGLNVEENGRMLSLRMKNPFWKHSGYFQGLGDRDANIHDVVFPTSMKLPYIELLPTYTTWIFLDRNQRMADDQSVVGRRRIYYDEEHGSEALICSDSEEDIAEPEEEKREFTEGEDRLLWTIAEDYGLGEEVAEIVSQFIGATVSEIEERYSFLKVKHKESEQNLQDSGDSELEKGIALDKSLSDALDSFDNLFCRRCLVFDCRLHGCSQTLIHPSEKQSCWSEYEDDMKPCSDQCYLWLKALKDVPEGSGTGALHGTMDKSVEDEDNKTTPHDAEKLHVSEDTDPVQVERGILEEAAPGLLKGECGSEVVGTKNLETPSSEIGENDSSGKRKCLQDMNTGGSDMHGSDDIQDCKSKKLKTTLTSDVTAMSEEATGDLDNTFGARNPQLDVVPSESETQIKNHEILKESVVSLPNKTDDNAGDGSKEIVVVPDLKLLSTDWKPIERELYLKGVEIFGRNSCLIARNILSGLKSCIEVSTYMSHGGASTLNRSIVPSSLFEEKGKSESDNMDQEMSSRPRLFRRKGKTRKLKYSWKSAGHPSMWKRMADGKNKSCVQYTPCGCQSMCGKQCSCLQNGTCCEKYCGCSKSCKNRFRGCHCAKSQCRSRQCPCFAAGRECDPDVCRNCWVSCGGGSLGEPPKRGDGQCGNMRLLLRQQQRILLGMSDVAGWGAFLKNSVHKNDYLGEYTGELISHYEADKRGKIYDLTNSSFLFDLNDQYVLDAYRKGDKLKFANHSSNPNCYAKVMLVAGDHRVGIFAKEHIEASEELFYDYRYGPDQAPIWARKPESSKRVESSASHGRAKKHQSH